MHAERFFFSQYTSKHTQNGKQRVVAIAINMVKK